MSHVTTNDNIKNYITKIDSEKIVVILTWISGLIIACYDQFSYNFSSVCDRFYVIIFHILIVKRLPFLLPFTVFTTYVVLFMPSYLKYSFFMLFYVVVLVNFLSMIPPFLFFLKTWLAQLKQNSLFFHCHSMS
jgi:hypothetical protein